MENLSTHPLVDVLAGLEDTTKTQSAEPLFSVSEDILSADFSEPGQSDVLAQADQELADPLVALALEEKTIAQEEKEAPKKAPTGKIRFLANYLATCSIIFVVLILGMNWKAYSILVENWISPEKLQQTQASITNALSNAQGSVNEHSEIALNDQQREEINKKKMEILSERLKKEKILLKKDWISMENVRKNTQALSYDIDITPYDNRVIIPKLGKNIPLVNVENQKIDNPNEWFRVFETELEKGIIKYPGSANPGDTGNSFIFGHSSNYPWIKGDYNDVFALLDKLAFGDEIIVYFHQKKYVYSVTEKHVIKPGYVNALKSKEEKKQLTLMTCWPIGTTLNRLIVMTELKEENPTKNMAAQNKLVSLNTK